MSAVVVAVFNRDIPHHGSMRAYEKLWRKPLLEEMEANGILHYYSHLLLHLDLYVARAI